LDLDFSQISQSHLYRLSQAVANITGKRPTIGDEAQLLSLMTYCDHSNDLMINKQYRAFIQSIKLNSLSELNAKKIKIVSI
jgi:hypothetical protein